MCVDDQHVRRINKNRGVRLAESPRVRLGEINICCNLLNVKLAWIR